jgi:glycosyltransferase involved in cell wall biosynthesis
MTSDRASILYLVSTLRQTGPTSQLLNLVRHLDRATFDPVIVTLSPEPRDSMLGSFQAIGVEVRSLAMSRARALVHRRWRADIALAAGGRLAGRCVVHSQGFRADAVSAKYLHGLPRVTTARNYPYDDYAMKFGRLPGRWMARRQVRAMRQLSVVVACSSTLAARLESHGLAPTVIRNGVDTGRFRPASSAERAGARERLGLPQDARVGICVGSLVARKNPVGVVRAARSVDAEGFVLALVGGGELEAECRRAAGADARIRFAGQVGDVLPWLHAADFLVSASHSEGLPNSVLEAMACGLPAILSDIPPHRELLELAPRTGTAFDAADEPSLAAAIRHAASSAGLGGGLAPGEARDLIGAQAMSRRYQGLYLRLAQAAVTAP